MINLIPPSAKKSILTEYWLRVLSAWFFVWSVAVLLGIAILVPAYVLISSQVAVYTSYAESASQKIVNFESVTKDLQRSGQQASTLVAGFNEPLISDYILMFKTLEYPNVTLSVISLQRTDKGLGPANITGEATDRQALAAFRERLLLQPEVTGVDLPISNLAKEKDIQFTLTVSLANPVKP